MKKSLMAGFLVVILMIAMVTGILLPIQKAEARGGGFGGGSFRGGGGSYEGARGGQVAWGPRGGAAAVGPGGSVAATGPYGATAVRGPQGNVASGYRVSAIPATATSVVVAGQTYYVDDNVYYQSYFDGSEVVYVVVPAPQ
jgi:hypothetical protein